MANAQISGLTAISLPFQAGDLFAVQRGAARAVKGAYSDLLAQVITGLVAQGAITGSGLTMSTARILGRTTAGTGALEEITVGSGLLLSGGILSAPGGSGTVTQVTSADGNATVATQTTTPVITIVSAPKWATARNIAGNSVDGSAAVTFANKFIVQGTADAGLTAAQFLGALGTGIVKNTVTTGVLSIAIAADFPTLNQSTTGSAATLTTPRAINGVNFDGSAPITVQVPVATGITGLGTGVATALAVNVGSAGAFLVFNGALGTPSSGTLTNCTGLPIAGGGTGQTTATLARNALNKGETPITDAATIATDCSLGNVFTVQITANRAMGAPSNQAAGSTYIWRVQQSSGGGNTLSWNSVFFFPGGTDPVLTTTANATDVISGVSDGTNIHCSFVQDSK
jgi:hypothetical protein